MKKLQMENKYRNQKLKNASIRLGGSVLVMDKIGINAVDDIWLLF